jgi:thioredoxin-related protein
MEWFHYAHGWFSDYSSVFERLVMNQRRKTLIPSLIMFAGFLSGLDVLAIDYQYEYEDDPAPSMIEEVRNLQEQAALAGKNRIPLLVEFSSPWCSYCEALEKEVLGPMLKSGDYRGRVIIRKLEVSDYNAVIDFTGQYQASVDLAMSMKVDLYPTLVFFNGEGKEISRRLVGITVLEFVSDELEKRLVQAEGGL